MRASTKKNNFTGGEISPLLHGRDDLSVYETGLKESKNCLTLEHGGITRRPGSRYVNEVKNSGDARIVPFIVSEDTAYILEIGAGYIRFYEGVSLIYGGADQHTNSNFTSSVPDANWLDASLGTGSAGYEASTNSAKLTSVGLGVDGNRGGLSQQTTLLAATDYRCAFKLTRDPTAASVVNFMADQTPNGDSWGAAGVSSYKKEHTFDFTTVGTTCVITMENWPFDAGGSDAFVEYCYLYQATVILEIANPWSASDLSELQFAQSNDVMYIVHPDYHPKTLTRASRISWTLADVVFGYGPFEPLYLHSSYLKWVSPHINTGVPDYLAGSTGTFVASGTGMGSGNQGEHFFLMAEDDPSKFCTIELTTHTGGVTFTATFLDDVPTELQGGATTRLFSKAAFTAANGYPAAVTFYEQRLCFGGNDAFPQTIWMSQSGGFDDFNIGIDDSDAVTFTLTGKQQNPIRWLADAGNLVSGNLAGEWSVRGGGFGDPITPTNIIPRQSTKKGSAYITPVDAGDDLAFVQRSKHRIFALVTNSDAPQHEVIDITLLAEHLVTLNEIVRLEFTKELNPIIWAVRDDGVLLSCTYNRDQKVIAFAQHDTLGTFIDVAAVPKATADQLWVIVEREINGSTVRYIEYLEEEDWRVHTDPYFMDCGATYESHLAATTISGLDHLEGEEVVVMADKEYIGTKTVASGSITLDTAASLVHVGLDYSSRFEELPEPVSTPDGSGHLREKRKNRVSLRLYNTVALNVNGDAQELPRDNPSATKPELFSGVVDGQYLGWDYDATNIVESEGPLPFTVLVIESTITVGQK